MAYNLFVFSEAQKKGQEHSPKENVARKQKYECLPLIFHPLNSQQIENKGSQTADNT